MLPTIYIYIYLENRADNFFCPLWVLPITYVFFVQLRIWVFDCEGWFKSYPPTVSKRGISARRGAKWESSQGAQIWPQMLTKFRCIQNILLFFQHNVEKTVSKCQHIAPNTVSTRDTILSEPVRYDKSKKPVWTEHFVFLGFQVT